MHGHVNVKKNKWSNFSLLNVPDYDLTRSVHVAMLKNAKSLFASKVLFISVYLAQ